MNLIVLQVVACSLSAASLWLCGHKSLWGPVLSVLDTAPWVTIAYRTHTPVVLAFDILMGGLSVRSLVLWRRDHATNTT